MASSTLPNARPPFYRDSRTIGIMAQVLFLAIVLLVGGLVREGANKAGTDAQNALKNNPLGG